MQHGGMTLFAVTHSSGQGHETVFPQIVAADAGHSVRRSIRFHPRPPDADLMGSGTGGSRGALGTGSAFRVLGEKLIERARPHAAAQLKVDAGELRYSAGAFHAGDRSLGFVELARALAGTHAASARYDRRRQSSAQLIRTAATSPKSRSIRRPVTR